MGLIEAREQAEGLKARAAETRPLRGAFSSGLSPLNLRPAGFRTSNQTFKELLGAQ